jgi:hypothetical protein
VDYWFVYSDDSSAGSYDPTRECFVWSSTTRRMERGGGWRRRSPPKLGKWSTPGPGAERALHLTGEG